jgi:hypothetical protein
MARGWESKSVEAQQEAADRTRKAGPSISRAEAERRASRETLILARTRARQDLDHARAAAHRAMLEATIAEIDRQIADLDARSG